MLSWWKRHPGRAGVLIALVQPMIKKLKPDIIGFEEVRDGDAVPIARKGEPGPLSRRPCQQTAVAAWGEAWKDGGRITPKRGGGFAAFQPSPGNERLVYLVHRKSNRGDIKENIAKRAEPATADKPDPDPRDHRPAIVAVELPGMLPPIISGAGLFPVEITDHSKL